jgi:hypothetical protein
MNLRVICYSLLLLFASTINALSIESSGANAAKAKSKEPKLTFYVPFDGSIDAKIAGGKGQGKFGAGETPQFAGGISSQGLLSGGNNQNVVYDAAGNISSEQWTTTFWMKGLPGAQWNSGNTFQTFWQFDGEQGEFMWFYHYMDKSNPWLLSQPRKGQGDTVVMFVPAVPEEQWHFWAVSWRKGTGAYIYLDGKLVGQSPCFSPIPIKNITIGQAAHANSPAEQNKVIDEFKIYDTALDPGNIARRYWQEGDFALHPAQTVASTKFKITVDGKIGAEEWKHAAGFTGLLNPKKWEVAAPQTWAKMTYDSQNLYLAMHSPLPPKASGNSGKSSVDQRFFLQVMPEPGTGKRYNLYFNEGGLASGSIEEKAASTPIAWKASVQVKSVLSANGWTIEAAIPLKSFGTSHLTDGTTWRVNLGRWGQAQPSDTAAWAVGKRTDEKSPIADSAWGTVSFSSKAETITDLRKFTIAPNGRISAALSLHNPGLSPSELSVTVTVADKVLQQQKVALQPSGQKILNIDAIPQDADGGLAEVSVKSGEKVLFRHAAPLILKRVGQLTFWSYPSLHQVRLGWVIQGGADPKALSLNTQLKDSSGKVVQNKVVKQLSSLHGSTSLDVKSLAPGKYILETQFLDGQNVLQEQAIAYEKKPLPSWVGNTLGISDTPPPPWTDVKVAQEKDTVSIWGRTYDYASHLLPTQIINQGKAMLVAPMRLIAQAADGTSQSSSATQANSQWTKQTATRADSLRSQTLGSVQVKSDSYVEYDGMSWMKLTVTPDKAQSHLKALTLEIPLKAEWASLIKPSDDYKMQQTGALPEKGWSGKASSMPWVGNGDGGIQFFQETTATWVGSKSIEVVPDGKGAIVMRVHLIDAAVTLNKPVEFAFGWITSPVKATSKNHRDWLTLSPGPIVVDPAGTEATASYVRGVSKLNPNVKPYFLWWQGWWWLPESFEGNADETGLLPVPSSENIPEKNPVVEHYGTKFYGAPYGRLTQMGTANPWFSQFADEWVRSTSKFAPNTSIPTARQITTISQASESLRDFYAWGYNQLLADGNVHALYFDESHPIFDDNIYRGTGTVLPDGSIEPLRNILGTRRTFQRLYTLLKAKQPDAKVFIHMSGDVLLPVDSFADALVDGENYYWLLNRNENRGYEKVLSVDQFRTEYSAQNNLGPVTVFLPQFGNANSINADDWKTLGLQPADYLLGLIFLHDSKMWWAYMPFDHLAKVNSAFDATGLNSQWSFTPYWRQEFISLPQGVYGSIYQSPDQQKMVLVLMNTSGQDQQIDIPLTLGKNTFKTAKAIYPDKPVNIEANKINALSIENNNFRAVVLEK